MSDDERKTVQCDKCGDVCPRASETNSGEKGIVWHEDTWMCEECKFKMMQDQRGSRSPRHGGKGLGSLGRRER